MGKGLCRFLIVVEFPVYFGDFRRTGTLLGCFAQRQNGHGLVEQFAGSPVTVKFSIGKESCRFRDRLKRQDLFFNEVGHKTAPSHAGVDKNGFDGPVVQMLNGQMRFVENDGGVTVPEAHSVPLPEIAAKGE